MNDRFFGWDDRGGQGHRVAGAAHVPRHPLRGRLLLYFAMPATRRPWLAPAVAREDRWFATVVQIEPVGCPAQRS